MIDHGMSLINDTLHISIPDAPKVNKVIYNGVEFVSGAQWIPCSKRMPSNEDYDETFTVTIQCEHYDGWDDYVTGYADWTPHGWDIQSRYIGQIKVIAWMPLPNSYKEEEDGCVHQ